MRIKAKQKMMRIKAKQIDADKREKKMMRIKAYLMRIKAQKKMMRIKEDFDADKSNKK